MSERRPDPPDPRASLVDSGWSEPAPAKERELPSYGDTAREHLVTRVDDQIQARIAAMNIEDRADLTDVTDGPTLQLPPPPPPFPQVPPPPLPSFPQTPEAPAPVPELSAAPTDEHTVVDDAPAPVSSMPPSRPPPSLPPPPLRSPSFAPMHSATGAAAFIPPPTLREALVDRVRIGGAELPLWGVLAPVVGVTALLSALLAGFLGPSGSPAPTDRMATGAAESASSLAASPSTPTPTADTNAAPVSQSSSLVERARSGDERAIGVIEHQRPQDRGADEALALASGKVAQAVSAVSKLRARLASDPGLAKDPKVVADLRRMAQDSDTSREALGAMAALPGSLSADLLYEAWTSTAERSITTELAEALLMGKDVRPKASPALRVAIDLREAESCEDNAKILQRAIDVGDKRAFAPLARLLRRNGCGPTKRDDCFACIREGDQLKRALTAVKLRREPELVRRDVR